ncbi:ribonuclease E/G-like protein, chloroplastic isoform X2 [Magnolia sinica]|uniref:ribonuclease E/G-like protein, chloroplastic isoform X2 n=1 Tax=Magnolia sinica TaxID=86752 RepID=UPI00265AE622|nr:ribonuclease E/G-like protein, chloroplastic isoform X2 [Magnolia sinica]
MVMGVCDVRPPPFPLGWNRAFRPSRFGVERALLPCLFHRMPLQNAFKITLHLRIQSCLLNSPVMSASKGNSTTKRWELCKVLWSIEADIEDGQLLHITGDLPALGCWEPDMAILMSPSREHANLWKTEIKVPCGLNFKYNYFVKGDKWPSSDLVWRPGPEFSLSVPLHFKQNEKIVVRDSWMKTRIERLPVPSWGSWMEDTYLLPQPIEVSGNHVPSAGEKDIIRSLKKISLGQKPFSVDLMVEDKSHSVDKEMTKNASNPRWNKALTISERDQPVEEPWLLQSSIFSFEFKETSDSNISSKGSIQNEGKQLDFHEKDDQGLEGVVPEEDNKLARIEESISTVILINSSICTMQRIAVLEDGKLVELLLEPVKNTVHCNSAYLGVVTKLVPHMGGAFVDIGISRPSLMDIKQNREPFVYPPFRRKTKERKVEGSLISDHKEHDPDAHEHDLAAHREDEIIDEFLDADLQDDSVESVRFMNEDFEEHEVEDDMDVSDALKGNINGAVFDYGGGEADFEDYFEENGHHIEGETVNEFLPLEMESSNDSELSHHMLQDLKVSDNSQSDVNKWAHVRKGTKVIVQVVKEGLGTKGPALTAYPNLKSRFWILSTRCDRIGVSKKIIGVERTRLRVIAKTLQPPGFGLTVRTVAAGHSLEELQKDLEGLLSTWKGIIEHAKSAALAADEGVEGAIPVILHRAMGQTLSVVQDYFNEKVKSMVVDSPRTYHEVTNYLQEIAPDLCDRVELYDKRIPIFDEYGIEEEINNILSKRVPLSNGGSLVIEQTEALVSIDVNGGHGMLGQGTSQEKAVLDVNLAAAKQIARELRLRDIGGIIVVDFIDMVDDSNKRLVYEEIKKAVERDRSIVKVSELSRHGLMEITRKRVRPSVSFMISEPCGCCHATGRVEALETSFSKIEHEICRLLAISNQKADPENAKSWPRIMLRVDRHMCNYLTLGKRTKLAVLSSSLKVWILLKVARGLARGVFEVKPFTDDKANSDQQQVAISRLRPTEGRSYIPSSKLMVFPVKKWKGSRK